VASRLKWITCESSASLTSLWATPLVPPST
jgi:hypothetical protein